MNYTGFNQAAMDEIAGAKYIAELDAMNEAEFNEYLDGILVYGEDEGTMDFEEQPQFGIKVRAVKR